MTARLNRVPALLALVAVGLCPTLVAAENAPREHDRGFLLRMSAGPGSAKTSTTSQLGTEAVEFDFSGTSGDGNFAIGAIVTRNLAVHGTFWGWSIAEPDVEALGRSGELDDVTLNMGAFGPGITWYFGQTFYLSGSIGAATMSMEVDGDDYDSGTGVAVDLTIGKEWWVGNRWGLGLAAGFGTHTIPTDDPNLKDDFNGTSFGLRFSATYN